MLPKHYFNDPIHGEKYGDLKWLEAQIDLLPIAIQAKVAKRYGDIYFKLENEDPRNARKRSNLWLVATVKKYKTNKTDGYF